MCFVSSQRLTPSRLLPRNLMKLSHPQIFSRAQGRVQLNLHKINVTVDKINVWQ